MVCEAVSQKIDVGQCNVPLSGWSRNEFFGDESHDRLTRSFSPRRTPELYRYQPASAESLDLL